MMFGDDKDGDPGKDWDDNPPIETESIWTRATGDFDNKQLEEATQPPSEPPSTESDGDS